MDNFNSIDQFKADVLRELGNIGSGNAATSLSQLIDNKVDISLPTVHFLEINGAASMLGGMEKISTAIFCEVEGDISGFILLILNLESTDNILRKLTGHPYKMNEKLDEYQSSALSEIGNILCSAYAASISNLLQINVRTSIPHICIDMIGAILSIPSVQMSDVSDKLIFIENKFLYNTISQDAEMFLVPDMKSFDKIMKNLGY